MKTSTVAEDLLEREALTGEDEKSGGSGSSGSGNWPDSTAEEGKKATTASGGEEGHNGLWDYYFDFFCDICVFSIIMFRCLLRLCEMLLQHLVTLAWDNDFGVLYVSYILC